MPTLSVLHPATGAASAAAGVLPPLVGQPVAALYVHVPFCFHKCHYCDFYSITHQEPQRMQAFVDRLLREAQQWAQRAQTGAAPPVQPRTIFFGGGTPSLLPLPAMQRLLHGLREIFDFSQLHEWTIEVNPATADADYCAMMRAAGVNRLSFGAQSFNQHELHLLERHHDPDDVPRSISLARAAGFFRLNLDLIFALPGQSMQSWMASLETALSLQPPHISCYALTYEPNTPMTVRLRMKEFEPAEESLELAMLHATRQRLAAAGLQPYEISNFATVGQACQHNLNYWTGGDYIGLGPSAASHISGVRWRNRPHLGEWERAVDAGDLPATDVETLTPSQRAGELAMLMLRLQNGIDFNLFHRRLNIDAASLFAPTIDRLTQLNLIQPSAAGVRLTHRGIELADAVAAEFLA